jgi:hypothetical protein
MPKTPTGRNRNMTKPMAWTSVGVGVALVVIGGIEFAYRMGPLPRGLFLALGVACLITAIINLKRAYDA